MAISGHLKALAVFGRKRTDALAPDGLTCSCILIVELADLRQQDLLAWLTFEPGFECVSSLALGCRRRFSCWRHA